MGRLSAFLLALVLGGASATALVSCGGSDAKLLPGTTANQIEANLDQVRQLVASGDCIGAEDAVAEVTAEVEELNGVAAKLQAALQEGTAKLSEVVSGCEEESSEETEPALETDVEEEVEPEKKPKKDKQPKEAKEPAEPKEEAPEAEEGPELPPQSNGKGEEKAGAPPVEPEAEEAAPPSGGVEPGVEVEK
jgi:hypothetical protein